MANKIKYTGFDIPDHLWSKIAQAAEYQPDTPGLEVESDFSEWEEEEAAEYLLTDIGLSIDETAVRLIAGGIPAKLINLGNHLGKYIVLNDDKLVDPDGYSDDISSFLWRLSDSDLGIYAIEVMDIQDDYEWQDVDQAYHATTEEKAQLIDKEGIRSKNESRGISNRGTPSAVFMSENMNEISPYGDVIFEIDLPQMKADGYMPPLDREGPISVGVARQNIAERFGVENPESYSGEDSGAGILSDTLVLFGDIPSKYIRRV